MRHVDWPADLPEEIERTSRAAVCKRLGVSFTSIRCRLRNYHTKFHQEKQASQWPDNLLEQIAAVPSFTDAARRLGIRPTTLTNRLRKLQPKSQPSPTEYLATITFITDLLEQIASAPTFSEAARRQGIYLSKGKQKRQPKAH